MINEVKKYRLSRQLTQTQLAEALGVSRQTIYSIESGKYIPSTLLALQIAAHFKIRVEDLFQLEKKERLL